MYHLEKRRRITYSFGYQADNIFVTLSIGRRHIVADADITAMQGRIKFAQFANALGIQVRYPAVVLTELLDDIGRYIAAADKILQQTGRYPLRILHVALLPGQLLDEVRIDQLQLYDVWFQHTPYRHPVDTGAFHTHFVDLVFLQHGSQLLQLRRQHAKLLMKNYTILIDNTRKDTIFVDVKTAYLSHRHSNFGTPSPLYNDNRCGAPRGDDRLPTKIRQRS